LLIADEPTTALDVTTQANILDLIRDLQRDLDMAVIFITHDLGVVAEIADEVAVMYLGTVVEHGSVDEIFADAKHPYTQALLRSIPRLNSVRQSRLDAIRGIVPHPLNRPGGCPFHNRCDFAVPGICDSVVPEPVILEDGRLVRCHIYSDEHHIPLDAVSSAPGIDYAGSDLATVDHRLLQVNELKMHFPLTSGFFNRVVGHVKAVDGVSFDIYQGETLGLVGESGCGKTTLGHCLMRLYNPTDGQMVYDNADGEAVDLAELNDQQLKAVRREIRMIFQDPHASLNPRLPVIEIVGEVLKVNGIVNGKELELRDLDLMTRVGLRTEYIRRYPHAFSGGERQRIGIARALAPNPKLVVADEPVSALDVSVQAQILNLLKDLQVELGLTYLFIAHDLSVVAYISDRVAVMYVGKIVELAETADLFKNPLHPYTEALLSSVLLPDPGARKTHNRIRLEGDVADPANPPTGCAFHPRCRYAEARCRSEEPPLRPGGDGHYVACHFAEDLNLIGVNIEAERPS
jgi:peptide/nickel transport system ATP-binding protein